MMGLKAPFRGVVKDREETGVGCESAKVSAYKQSKPRCTKPKATQVCLFFGSFRYISNHSANDGLTHLFSVPLWALHPFQVAVQETDCVAG